jgi:hypothetical protein
LLENNAKSPKSAISYLVSTERNARTLSWKQISTAVVLLAGRENDAKEKFVSVAQSMEIQDVETGIMIRNGFAI